MSNKLIVITAPSGAGKSSICRHVLDAFPEIWFSVSATTRPPRDYEIDGVHYRFLSTEAFLKAIRADELLEYEEVYPGIMYGTLRADVERALETHHVLLDIDVKGAKRRNTETDETLNTRLKRAEEELAYESCFDATILNDSLETAVDETIRRIEAFTKARSQIGPESG